MVVYRRSARATERDGRETGERREREGETARRGARLPLLLGLRALARGFRLRLLALRRLLH